MSRELEIIELIQLFDLKKQNSKYAARFEELKAKYSEAEVSEYSASTAVRIFVAESGYLRRQKCTNSECGVSFIAEDISGLCDECNQPTLRLL